MARTFASREDNKCIGWACLTSAEQFGTAFSIAVIGIVLSLLGMYYMGRAKLYRRDLYLERQRRDHRGSSGAIILRRDLRTRSAVPPAVLGVIHQPTMYYLTSTAGPGPQPQRQPPAMLYQMAAYPQVTQLQPFPVHAASVATRGREPWTQSEVAPSLREDGELRSPTWLQRMYRAFRLPVGRASTIASTTGPGSRPRSPQIPEPDASASKGQSREADR